MSSAPLWPLQQALYARLSADEPLTETLGLAVYDFVPDRAAFPYLVLGEVLESPNGTMGRDGRDVILALHTWSQAKSMKQLAEIHNQVDFLLDGWAPSLEGWEATELTFVSFHTLRDPDGATRHSVDSYRVHLNPTIEP